MADSSDSQPIARSTKLVSEALLNEKWDRAISSMIIRSSLGLSFGVVFSVLLFKRRAWPAWVGLGFGAGRAWEEADASFRRGDSPVREALRR
ncbi:MICOS complex subunit MIC10 [Aspergillus undulatus]|uniref:MICOS complex subunit MIC10 n=1 Tax=Aspergillus undulatus TaxID=1810928 RepID=UPI003CCE4F0A